MTDNVLPISDVINISIQNTPSGLVEPNVNALALFTTETPDNILPYGNYVGATQVASDYGTNSLTAAMANAIFSQSPNILAGNGNLVIIPMLGAVSATAGFFTTASLTANVAAIIVVTNGHLKVTINSVVYNLQNLNFTGCVTLADIASIFDAALPDANVTANTTELIFTSNKVGTTSTVAMAAFAGGTDLTGAGLLDTAAGVATAGAASSGETVLQCIARTSGLVGYFGIITSLNLEDSVIETTAAGVQALNNMFLHHCSSIGQDITGLATTISQATETKTRILPYSTGQPAANLYKAAYAGAAFSTDFSGSNTSTTRNLKPLAGIVPDPGVTQTIYQQALTAGCDLYVSFAGVPSIVSTGGNDYFDNIYTNGALTFDLETAGFDYLRETNTKVPQTEQGMNGLKDAYRGVMVQYVNNGCFAPGQWNSSETFGNQTLFLNNILTQGFYIYSQPVAQQAQNLRELREAPLIQIAAKRAGAIQSSNVQVIIEQ